MILSSILVAPSKHVLSSKSASPSSGFLWRAMLLQLRRKPTTRSSGSNCIGFWNRNVHTKVTFMNTKHHRPWWLNQSLAMSSQQQTSFALSLFSTSTSSNEQSQQFGSDSDDISAPSSASNDLDKTASSSQGLKPINIPTRHSSRKLPRVCIDSTQLDAITQYLLEEKSRVGSLYTYIDRSSRKDISNDLTYSAIIDHRNEAWADCGSVIQMAEYVIRGYSYRIPGTIWNRWLNSSLTSKGMKVHSSLEYTTNEEIENAIMTMEAIIDRLWDEGVSYMKIRASRMEELYGIPGETDKYERYLDNDEYIDKEHRVRLFGAEGSEKDFLQKLKNELDKYVNNINNEENEGENEEEEDEDEDEDDEEDEEDAIDIDDYTFEGADDDNHYENENDYENENENENDYENENENGHENGHEEDYAVDTNDDEAYESYHNVYVEDFAPPGPTIAMYDTILDAMAVAADRLGGTEQSGACCASGNAMIILERLLVRHKMDTEWARIQPEQDVQSQQQSEHYYNKHTLPTILSYNAVLRVASNQPVVLPMNTDTDSLNIEQQQLRDETLDTAWNIFMELSMQSTKTNKKKIKSSINSNYDNSIDDEGEIDNINDQDSVGFVQRNTSTYVFMLRTLYKCLPTSMIKGNVLNGIYQHAKTQGLLSDSFATEYFKYIQEQPNDDTVMLLQPHPPAYIRVIEKLSAQVERKVKKNINTTNDDNNIYNRNNDEFVVVIQPKFKRNSKKLRYIRKEDIY